MGITAGGSRSGRGLQSQAGGAAPPVRSSPECSQQGEHGIKVWGWGGPCGPWPGALVSLFLETGWAWAHAGAPDPWLSPCPSCHPRPWFLKWRMKTRKMTQRMPSTNLISWAQERTERALQTPGDAPERGPTMNWVSWGFSGPPSSLQAHTAACSCFLPQGLHRTDTLPERRVAKESGRPAPRWPGLHSFPGKPLWGHRQARLFLQQGLQSSTRAASCWRTSEGAGWTGCRPGVEKADGAVQLLLPVL